MTSTVRTAPSARSSAIAALTRADRRMVLTVRGALRWGTFPLGEHAGQEFQDSSQPWRVEVLAHWFAAQMGGWGGDLDQAIAG
jgi:hypothetical protein